MLPDGMWVHDQGNHVTCTPFTDSDGNDCCGLGRRRSCCSCLFSLFQVGALLSTCICNKYSTLLFSFYISHVSTVYHLANPSTVPADRIFDWIEGAGHSVARVTFKVNGAFVSPAALA